VGLSVTMGLMGFVNLAHGGFAMLGGYAIVLSMRHWGLPFSAASAGRSFSVPLMRAGCGAQSREFKAEPSMRAAMSTTGMTRS